MNKRDIEAIHASKPFLQPEGERLGSTDLFASLVEKWEARIRATPERAKAGGVEYVGGLIDAYSACLEELNEILEANAECSHPNE